MAMALVGLSPVFVSGALEAKPHVPAACLTLCAIERALRYFGHGRRRDAVGLGVFAGLSAGFVLTGLATALIWPVLWWVCPPRRRAGATPDLLLGSAIAVGVYLATNPYIPINLLFNREALLSNLSNSTAMYEIARLGEGCLRVGELLLASAGAAAPIAGAVGAVICFRGHPRATTIASIVAIGFLVLGCLIGAGKPAEFARFLLIPAVLLCIGAAIAFARAARRPAFSGWLLTAVALLVMRPDAVPRHLARDLSRSDDSRTNAAEWLAARLGPTDRIGVFQEPAPYSIPPLDFAHRSVFWMPESCPAELKSDDAPEWLLRTFDGGEPPLPDPSWEYGLVWVSGGGVNPANQITWADKPVAIWRRR
jgi:hypothetical protein